MPGHKHRARVLDADLGLAADPDVPLYGGLDTMKLTGGNLVKAEALAARLWQADWCRFSVGGATPDAASGSPVHRRPERAAQLVARHPQEIQPVAGFLQIHRHGGSDVGD